jgi:anti-sigma factor RsiW
MNCRQFQDELYEYLEGSLSLQDQAAAEAHLAQCAACRLAFQGERETARRLSNTFRGATDALRLPPEVGRRVVTALSQPRGAAEEPRIELCFWRRWAWPLAAAAVGLALLLGFFFFAQAPGPRMARPQPPLAGEEASIQLSYVVPTYVFRREGGFVVDALTYQTNVVNQKLRVEMARLE